MSHFKDFLLFCLAVTLLCAPAVSQTNDTPAQPFTGSKRWLLVFETSSAMAPRKQAVMESLAGMLESQMDGQLQPGDTIGAWTFNKQLYAGKLPLHTWLMGTRKRSAMEIMNFMEKQKFEHASNLEVLAEPLSGVAGNSKLLTVVLVSSGQGKLSGTPFDDEITRAWASWGGQKSRNVIVTVLRARDGKYVQQRVTSGEFAPGFPPLPKAAAITNAPPAAASTPGATSKVVAPLIFTGPNKKGSLTNGPQLTNMMSEGAKQVVESTNSLPIATTQRPPVGVPSPDATQTQAVLIVSNAVGAQTQTAVLQSTGAQPSTNLAAATSGPDPTAVVAPTEGETGRLPRAVLYVAGALIVLGAIIAAFLIGRRRGADSDSSLITKSIDEDKRGE